MTHGIAVSDDLRIAILGMDALGVPRTDICNYTGMSRCSIRRYVQVYQETGVFSGKQSEGRKPVLSTGDIEVGSLSIMIGLLFTHS